MLYTGVPAANAQTAKAGKPMQEKSSVRVMCRDWSTLTNSPELRLNVGSLLLTADHVSQPPRGSSPTCTTRSLQAQASFFSILRCLYKVTAAWARAISVARRGPKPVLTCPGRRSSRCLESSWISASLACKIQCGLSLLLKQCVLSLFRWTYAKYLMSIV